MTTVSELLALSKTYLILTVIIALILFIVGFKFAKKIMWGLAILALIIAIILIFF